MYRLNLFVIFGLFFCCYGCQPHKKNLGVKDIKSQWYSKQLKALREPYFEEFKNSAEEEAYRFIWLRTFHNPVAIRVTVKEDNYGILSLKVTSGKGGYKPGRIIKKKKIELSESQIDDLRSVVESNKFWEEKKSDSIYNMGLDGAQWIVEVKCEGDYHYIDEWSPEHGCVRNIGLYLLKISGYKPDDIY
jgi:hypothetical protein